MTGPDTATIATTDAFVERWCTAPNFRISPGLIASAFTWPNGLEIGNQSKPRLKHVRRYLGRSTSSRYRFLGTQA